VNMSGMVEFFCTRPRFGWCSVSTPPVDNTTFCPFCQAEFGIYLNILKLFFLFPCTQLLYQRRRGKYRDKDDNR